MNFLQFIESFSRFIGSIIIRFYIVCLIGNIILSFFEGPARKEGEEDKRGYKEYDERYY
jgi:hypothetical protein